nr:unnamed protein product [Digitaria exilis]
MYISLDLVFPIIVELEEVARCDGGVPVEFAVVPCALGAGALAGGAGEAPAGADGGGVGEAPLGAGGGGVTGVLGGVVVGADAGGGTDAEVAGGGGEAAGGDGGAAEVAGGGDGDASGGDGGAGVVGAGAPPPVSLLPAARTMTMSFSLLRQLASTPLMKKRAPGRSRLYTVSPSSNLCTYADVLQALYSDGSTSSTESWSFGYTNTDAKKMGKKKHHSWHRRPWRQIDGRVADLKPCSHRPGVERLCAGGGDAPAIGAANCELSCAGAGDGDRNGEGSKPKPVTT